MKKLLVICFALAASTVAAQNMNDIANTASHASSDDMISQLVGSQVKSLAQKFNLTEAQADQASAVVEQVLKSPKLKSLLAKYSPGYAVIPLEVITHGIPLGTGFGHLPRLL